MQHIDFNTYLDIKYEAESKDDLARSRLSRADETLIDSIELRTRGYSKAEIKALHSEDHWGG